MDPGPNLFSDSTENVFVDSFGCLHLRITSRNGHWYCAEVTSREPVGLGDYSLHFETSLEFDRNVVFGAFTLAEAQPQTREVDMLELGDFGNANDPTNAQFVVQQWQDPTNIRHFTLPSAGPIVSTMTWPADAIRFGASSIVGESLAAWEYRGRVPDDYTDATRYRLNLWLFNGVPPSDGKEVEVVVSTVSFPTKPLQRLIAAMPTTGAGENQAFTAVFRHPEGPSGHYLGYVLLLPTPNIVWFTAKGSCLVEYNRISHGMRLINDGGDGWLGPPQELPVGFGGALTNSQCTINVGAASLLLAGDDMIVTIPVTFRTTGMSVVLGTFIQELDVHGNWTDMRQFGNWVLPGAPVKSGPSVGGIAPAQTIGTSETYTMVVSHTSGPNALSAVHLLIATKIVDDAPCQIVYFPTENALNLVNDTGTALVAPSPVALGSSASLSNSRCIVQANGASRTSQGNSLVLIVPISFNKSMFSGRRNVYMTWKRRNLAIKMWRTGPFHAVSTSVLVL